MNSPPQIAPKSNGDAAETIEAAVSPGIDVMDTNGAAFEEYVAGRTTRTNVWFVDPSGRIELCNLHPPVRSAEK